MLSRTTGFATRLAALLMLAGIAIYAMAGASGSASEGSVAGTVEVIQSGAVVPWGTDIVFSGSGGKEYTTRAGSGHYLISLPAPDVYRVRMQIGDCWLSRAAFHLKPGEKLELRFLGVACPSIEFTTSNIPLEANRPLLPPEVPPLCTFPDGLPVWYREQRFKADPFGHRPEVVVSFGRCEQSGEGVTYFDLDASLIREMHPKAAGDASMPVAITTERYTVRADQVTWTSREFNFYASGNVTIEDGRGHVTNPQSATISFNKGHPVIKT
jgi:hypothetical protein